MAAKRPHVMTPARLAHLAEMREKATLKRAAEGTEPQREGGRKRHARPAERDTSLPGGRDASPGVVEPRFSTPPAPSTPAATPPASAEPVSDSPPPPARAAQSVSAARPARPTPASDLRGLAARLRRAKAS